MIEIRWEFVIPALLVGGVLGALIAGLLRKRRAKFHPIGIKKSINPIFPAMERKGLSDAKVILKYNEVTFLATQLFIVEFQMVNLGAGDLREFKFGITLPADHNIIASSCQPPDKNHEIDESPSVSPESWAKAMDFTLRPFDRRDSYLLKLYIHVGSKGRDVGKISLNTAEQARFVDLPAIGKQLEEAVKLLGHIPLD